MNATPVPSYSPAERQRRWDLARSFMDREGLDALLVFGEHEDSGPGGYSYDTWFTNDRPGATVVFPREAETPSALLAFVMCTADHQESSRRGDALWLPAEQLRLGRDATATGALLRELGLESATVGVLGLEPHVPFHATGIVPYGLWKDVLSHFPEATFRSVGDAWIRATMALGPEEVAVVRRAAAIGEDMAKAMVASIQPGARENDVFLAGMAAAIRNGTAPPWMHLSSGPDAVVWGPPRWAWRAQEPREIQRGDTVVSEIFTSLGMRTSQHQLCVAVGDVHPDMERAAGVARACYEAGLAALRPGARFDDVCAAMRRPVDEAGGWSKGPQIHGLNPLAALCGFTGPTGVFDEAGPYPAQMGMDTVFGDVVLQPGMTFAFEPSCGFGPRGVTIGGTVIVGDEAAIELNPFTSKMHRVQW